VKGMVHPPDRAIAFLRYYPSPTGRRRKAGRSYAKVYHLAERFDILRRSYPHYLYYDRVFGRELQGIPAQYIKKIYRPAEALKRLRVMEQLDPLQQDVVTFARLVQQAARLPPDRIGVSGSVMVDLHGPTSDIDLIVYGREAGQAVQLALRRAHLSPEYGVAGYRMDTYRPIYNLRWSLTGIPIEVMLRVDAPKSLHGTFGGHHYFVRVVLDWEEVEEHYGDRTYRPLGYAQARCRVTSHAESIFTPCRYEVDDVQILSGPAAKEVREIASFRGRFCEQARQDDVVLVQGMLEEVRAGRERWHRFLLGDRPTDIMIPERLLHHEETQG